MIRVCSSQGELIRAQREDRLGPMLLAAREDDDRSRLLGQWVDAWRTVRVRCRTRSENSEQRAEVGSDT